MSKKNSLEDEFEAVYYFIFCRGILNISFSAKQYTECGAISRYRILSRDFHGLKLIAANNRGETKTIYPIVGKVKRRPSVIEDIKDIKGYKNSERRFAAFASR